MEIIGIILVVLLGIIILLGVGAFILFKTGSNAPTKAESDEMMKQSQKIMLAYQRSLTERHKQLLQKFLQSGRPLGSTEYYALPALLQEIYKKLQFTQIDIMIKGAKNPIVKWRLQISKIASEAMLNNAKKAKAKEKAKAKALEKGGAIASKNPVDKIKGLFAKKKESPIVAPSKKPKK